MQAGFRCPQCGGGRVHQITPGYFECLEEIAVGGIPPGATGLPHPILDIRRCDTRFQIGPAGQTSSCALCGLDSIGTCEGGCGRRLCGKHGTIDPPFLCRSCIERLAAERKRKEDEHIAERAEGLRRTVAQMKDATDPSEIARLLRERSVSAEDCLGPWDRLVASGLLGQAPYEMVMVTIADRRIFGNAAREGRRIGAWRYCAPLAREREWQLIDEEGTLWDEDGELPGTSNYAVLPSIVSGKPRDQFVAVAQGGEVVMRVRRGARAWVLEGGRPMHRHAKRSSERFPAAVLGAIEYLNQEASP